MNHGKGHAIGPKSERTGVPIGEFPAVKADASGRAGGAGWCVGICWLGCGEALDEVEPWPIEDFQHQAGEVAAVFHDECLQFPPQRMVGHDAEIAADIGNDGADGLAADLSGDLLRHFVPAAGPTTFDTNRDPDCPGMAPPNMPTCRGTSQPIGSMSSARYRKMLCLS